MQLRGTIFFGGKFSSTEGIPFWEENFFQKRKNIPPIFFKEGIPSCISARRPPFVDTVEQLPSVVLVPMPTNASRTTRIRLGSLRLLGCQTTRASTVASGPEYHDGSDSVL